MVPFQETCHARRVAVIGAGPGGLAAAKYLRAEQCFDVIHVFEQRSSVGGVWNATLDDEIPDAGFQIPRTLPTTASTQPNWKKTTDGTEYEKRPVFLSPIYDSLDTNIPHTLMNFHDTPFPSGCPLFPPHTTVRQYLEDYAEDLSPFLKLDTQVLNVIPVGFAGWSVTTKAVATGSVEDALYDAVIVASGHYDDPYVPDIPGISEWDRLYPDSIVHSKFYRRANKYKNKKVVVVGNSASGIDISREVSTLAHLPVLISEKETAISIVNTSQNLATETVGVISSFDIRDRTVYFSCGRKESNVDNVIFCTGYMYSYPFLKDFSTLPLVSPTGSRVENLYYQMVYHPRPTLFFTGLPQRIVPFPVSEAQSAVISRILSGRLSLPSQEKMEEWEQDRLAKTGDNKLFHNLKYPQDADYINSLFEWASSATRNDDLENEGIGKLPPYWGEQKKWLRSILPQVKEASKKLGQQRFKIRTLEELGFVFPVQDRAQL